MVERLEFLKGAIEEAQLTIRALDVKLAALLVAVCVPVPLLSGIAQCLEAFAALTCPLPAYQSKVEVRVEDYSMDFGVDGN